MKCKVCGADGINGQLFCPNCGAKMEPSNKSFIPIIAGAFIFSIVLVVGVFVVGISLGNCNKNNLKETVDETVEDDSFDIGSEDTTDDSDDAVTDGAATDDIEENTGEAEIEYEMLYSYYELPDVVSIDTDPRFTYYDYYYGEDMITYTFSFSADGATEEDFYTAVEDYCSVLTDWNGFYYEEAFSQEQYEINGYYTDYFSQEDVAVGVTSSVEATGWYAYIDIYFLEDSLEDSTDVVTYPNYSYYIEGRDSKYFEFGNEVLMENGVAFFLNEANIYDRGDGTADFECTMDLAASYADTYLYMDDFLVVPMDSEGNVLSDACMIEYVIDAEGNYVSEPYLLDTEYYYSYTVTFVVPSNTTALTFYGNNYFEGYSSGPVYYFDMEVIE